MTRLARTTFLHLLLGLTLLMPSGWKLCVASDGHWVLEPGAPGAAPCCASDSESGPADACRAEGCAECQDLALSDGHAVHSRFDSAVAPLTALSATCISLFRAVGPAAMVLPPPALPRASLRTRASVLRC